MILQIKAELKKLLTIRSTYILVFVALALVGLFTYLGTSALTYEQGTCSTTGEVLYSNNYLDPRFETQSEEEICSGEVTTEMVTETTLPKEKLLYTFQEAIPVSMTFITIIFVLMIAHEFRHNTISYTLTISNSRSKVLAAKILVAIGFATAVLLLTVGVTVATMLLAVDSKNLTLPPQDYDWLYIMARHLVYVLGSSLFFMGLTVLLKNLTASIAAVFILPTIEGLGSFLLASREIVPSSILPFAALDRFGAVASDVANNGTVVGEAFMQVSGKQPPSAFMALAIFGVYFVCLWVITWVLFLKRDAN